MMKAVESICALCLIGAFMDLLHSGGRFHRLLRMVLGIMVIRTLMSIINEIIGCM